MTRQITHVSIHQTSKVMALMYLCLSLLVVPVGIAMMAVYPQGRGMGLFLLFAPVIYAVGGYLGCALFGVLYNLIASRFGGVEFESVDKPGAA